MFATIQQAFDYAMYCNKTRDEEGEEIAVIVKKEGKYTAGKWDELDYAKKCGWEFVATVAEIARSTNK